MKIKTAEATGLQLDWGLAVVLSYKPVIKKDPFNDRVYVDIVEDIESQYVGFLHTDPAVCMGLIKEYRLPSAPSHFIDGMWFVFRHNEDEDGLNGTLEQAVARCVISMKLGEEFEVPNELGVMG